VKQQSSSPNIQIKVARNSGLLQAKCLLCGKLIAWSKNPKTLLIAARAHKCDSLASAA
jgi:hypothetical protein